MGRPFFLDKTVIPSDYIRAIEVGRAKHISLDKLEQYAKDTYQCISFKKRELNISTWAKMRNYYNAYSNGLTADKEVNFFQWHTKLQPIAHLFQFFFRKSLSKDGNYHYKYDFGVLQAHYDYYKKHGKPPEVLNRGALSKSLVATDTHSRAKIRITDIDVPRTEVYERFLAGVKAVNKRYPDDTVTLPEVVLSAMAEYMAGHPEIFDMESDFEYDESLVRKRSGKTMTFEVEPTVSELVGAVIERYNALNVAPINQSDFLNTAVKAHLQRIPIEYTDPELAKRIKEIEGNG